MHSLAIRSHQEEQMDAVDLDGETYARVLADLSRVNRWTLTAMPVLGYLQRAAASLSSFSLLDVGFGDGDILRSIARWAHKRNITARLTGVDLNARSADIARAATPAALHIDYHTGDYLDLRKNFDFVISSQVTHHMSDAQLREFLIYMEANARKGWLICDLHRHGFAYAGFPLLARLMRVHRIVREDGRLSIARSFRPDEWPKILTNAGIASETVRIVRRFPFRLCVERIRQGALLP
jgi:2-polyprenyl-3-methyl-5-hydroxy-6-metoxy-1,4-benzoquinol methylase